jgi:hypothetical protein
MVFESKAAFDEKKEPLKMSVKLESFGDNEDAPLLVVVPGSEPLIVFASVTEKLRAFGVTFSPIDLAYLRAKHPERYKQLYESKTVNQSRKNITLRNLIVRCLADDASPESIQPVIDGMFPPSSLNTADRPAL